MSAWSPLNFGSVRARVRGGEAPPLADLCLTYSKKIKIIKNEETVFLNQPNIKNNVLNTKLNFQTLFSIINIKVVDNLLI